MHNYSSDSAVQSSSRFSLLCSPIFHPYSDFYFEVQKLYPYSFIMCQSMSIDVYESFFVRWKLHAITERSNIICGCCILWKKYRDESGWHGYHSGVLELKGFYFFSSMCTSIFFRFSVHEVQPGHLKWHIFCHPNYLLQLVCYHRK